MPATGCTCMGPHELPDDCPLNTEYGLYLFDGWVMLYSPKWVEASGIRFIASDVVDFPGCEE